MHTFFGKTCLTLALATLLGAAISSKAFQKATTHSIKNESHAPNLSEGITISLEKNNALQIKIQFKPGYNFNRAPSVTLKPAQPYTATLSPRYHPKKKERRYTYFIFPKGTTKFDLIFHYQVCYKKAYCFPPATRQWVL